MRLLRHLLTRQNRVLTFVLTGVLLVLCLLAANRYSRTTWYDAKSPLAWDGSGYYVYLPGWVVHPYMKADRLPQEIVPELSYFQADTAKNRIFTKFSTGVATVHVLPYAATHALRQAMGHTGDHGFEPVYQITILLSVIVLVVLGLGALLIWLRQWVPQGWAIAAVLLLFLGSPAYWYAVYKPAFSHATGFALVCMLLWTTHRLYSRYSTWRLASVLCLLSLVVLVRPSNFIFGLIPLLYPTPGTGGWGLPALLKALPYRRATTWLAVLPALVVAVPQFYYWWWYSGSAVMYSYTGETFDFAHPYFFSYIISPLNGILAYHPLWALPFIGTLWLAWQRSYWAVLLLVVFVAGIYFNSSWWCWWYGGSYGQRTFTEYVALGVLPLALMLRTIPHRVRWVALGLAMILVYKNVAYGLYGIDWVDKYDAYNFWYREWLTFWG